LTDTIGLGTTLADQIAATTVSGLGFTSTATVLFSGLDLGPGTYYLISASSLTGPGVGWNFYFNNSAIPGISGTNNPDVLGFGKAAYPPASNFDERDLRLAFSVSGDPIAATPEPSSLILLGTGVLGVAGAARRKYLSS